MAITDVNDNAPIFSESESYKYRTSQAYGFTLFYFLATYTATVPENLASNGSIQQVTATDGDSGINQELTYQIVDATILPNSQLNDLDSSVSSEIPSSFITSVSHRLSTLLVSSLSPPLMAYCLSPLAVTLIVKA